MSELERTLERIGADFPFPATPDAATAVRARLHRRRLRRAAILVLATLVVAASAVLAASPSARSTFLDWFGIGGVEIRRVESLPAVPTRGSPDFGERVTLAEARRRAAFPLAIPTLEWLAEPDAVYVSALVPGGMVTVLYGTLERPRLAITQWQGRVVEPVVIKLVPEGTATDYVDVNGHPGVWLHGAPHVFFLFAGNGREYEETLHLAGNVLVWEHGSRSFRMQVAASRAEALTIARSMR